MSIALLKPLVALLPACLLFVGSAVTFIRAKTLIFLMQLVGATAIVIVVLTHLCEALVLFPAMH